MTFTPGEPFNAKEPTVVVDAGLPPGRHRFQLFVVGASGRVSQTIEAIVTVLPPETRIRESGPVRRPRPTRVPRRRPPP